MKSKFNIMIYLGLMQVLIGLILIAGAGYDMLFEPNMQCPKYSIDIDGECITYGDKVVDKYRTYYEMIAVFLGLFIASFGFIIATRDPRIY